MHTSTNSQVLSADRQVLFRQVTINGAPYWQAQSGRTFPVVAGAEDGEGDGNNGENDADAEQDSADNYDKERGFKKIQAQAADLKKLKVERDALRAQAKELDALKAKQKERDDAEKSEADRLKEQVADLERKSATAAQTLTETLNRTAIERAATKAGVVDPEDVHRLLNADSFEHDETGNVTNAEQLVKDLLKAKPYLAAKVGANGVPPTPRSNGTQTHEDRVKENIKKLQDSGVYAPL